MWAIARIEFGLGAGEFGRMTPRQFRALYDRWEQREKREHLRAGIIASTVANFAGRSMKDGDTMSPLDFVPGYKREPEEMTPEQLAQAFMAMPAVQIALQSREKKPEPER